MALHERLVLDDSSAFVVISKHRDTPVIERTKDGMRWLRDLDRYNRLFNAMDRAEETPELMLREAFGYVTRSEETVMIAAEQSAKAEAVEAAKAAEKALRKRR